MTIKFTTRDVLNGTYLVLLLAILVLLLWSQPWQSSSKEIRKITVSGEGTVQSVPDEYVFSPYFEVKGTEQEELRERVSKLANDAVEALKALGVDEKSISLDASSYDSWYWEEGEEGVFNAYITVKVNDKDLAQKVQDYLLNTDAKGQLTSQEMFSEEKQKALQQQATEKAIADARAKAESQASLFGAKLGKVIEVRQNENLGVLPFRDMMTSEVQDSSLSSLPVLPGEQDFSTTVEVIYELR